MNNTLRRAATWIAEHEFWLLWVYGVPLLFASNLPLELFLSSLLTVPFFWVARRLARGAWTIMTPLDIPLALLLALGIVGVVVSNDAMKSVRQYGELFGGVALFYSVVNGLPSARITRGAWLVVLLGIGMGLLGVAGLRYTDKFLPLFFWATFLPRLDVTALNPRGFTPNVVAGAIAPAAALALAWGWSQARWRRLVVLGGGLILITVVLLTQSRGALLGIVLALAAFLISRFPRTALLLPVAALVIAAGVYWTPLRDEAQGLLDDPSSTLHGRMELWERATFVMRDFPFTGIGLGTFDPNALTLYPLFENRPGEPQPHAHNLYLQMGVDYGIGGVVAFLGLVTTILAVGVANARRLRGTQQGWLAIGLLAGLVAFLGHGLLDAVFTSTKVGLGVWLILALNVVLSSRHE